MEPDKDKNRNSRKRFILKLTGITLYLIVIIVLYYFLISSGFNPIIISILLVFIILTTIGPFLRPKRRKLYSRLFSGKKGGSYTNEIIKKSQNKDQKELDQQELRIPKPVNLEFEYRKSLIKKCKNCGNIVPNFVKKCPFCNKNITQ